MQRHQALAQAIEQLGVRCDQEPDNEGLHGAQHAVLSSLSSGNPIRTKPDRATTVLL